MKDYLYDGTFEGALTGIYYMFKAKEKLNDSRLLLQETYQMSCLNETIVVQVNAEHVDRVTKWILEAFGEHAFRHLTYAFLAEDTHYGTFLFNYLKRLNQLGAGGVMCLSDPYISQMYKLYNRVTRESHLFLGLLRFSELENGILYAAFEPTQNIVPLLTGHFKERLGAQSWVIHDVKRGLAAFYDGTAIYIKPLEMPSIFNFSERERKYRSLWKKYFKAISIDERLNPKQQKQMMPKKYWKFLVETPSNMNIK